MSLQKSAVVTGGSKGIGKAIILKLASEGYDIYTCSRGEESLLQLANEVKILYPKINIYSIPLDISKKEQAKDFVSFVKTKCNHLDILVNNAGTFIQGKTIEEADDTLSLLLETNLLSAYYVTKGLLSLLSNNEPTYIFNMCSVASIQAYPNGGSYSVSKFALLGYTKALRQELLNTNIKVSAILPGATWSDSWNGVDLPKDRLMEAEDIAKIIVATTQLSPSAVIEDIILRPQLGDI